MIELLNFIYTLLQLYIYVLIASAIFSWLYAFGVINSRNPVVAAIGQFLYVVTEPALRPIRNFLNRMFGGNTGGIDFSPIVLILIIWFIQGVIIPTTPQGSRTTSPVKSFPSCEWTSPCVVIASETTASARRGGRPPEMPRAGRPSALEHAEFRHGFVFGSGAGSDRLALVTRTCSISPR